METSPNKVDCAYVNFLINKPKRALLSKFKFLFALKFNCLKVNFIHKYQNLVISKSGKSHNKIVNLEVENFEL